jgi:hypothetical protein
MQEYPEEAARHVAEFLAQHGLQSHERLAAERKAIAWAREVRSVVAESYAELTDAQLKEFAGSGMILYLLHRGLEHLEAAIVGFTTSSELSSEVLSRASLELSGSIEFILQGQPESRLLAYFENYLSGESKRFTYWQRAIDPESEDDNRIHTHHINPRREGVEAMSSFVTRLREEFVAAGVPVRPEQWPDVASRFEASKAAVGYRTFYARMSGQVHSDAEETIRAVMARVSEKASLVKRMAIESRSFSRLMLYFAVKSFLCANERYARYYSLDRAESVAKHGQSMIERELDAIVDDLENIRD